MRIGFIGLGAMGRPIASNLQRAGHALQVFDLRRVEGFDWRDSPRAASDGCSRRRATSASCARCSRSTPTRASSRSTGIR